MNQTREGDERRLEPGTLSASPKKDVDLSLNLGQEFELRSSRSSLEVEVLRSGLRVLGVFKTPRG